MFRFVRILILVQKPGSPLRCADIFIYRSTIKKLEFIFCRVIDNAPNVSNYSSVFMVKAYNYIAFRPDQFGYCFKTEKRIAGVMQNAV